MPETVELARLKKTPASAGSLTVRYIQVVMVTTLELRFSAGMVMLALVPLKPAAVPVSGVAPGRPKVTLL